MDGANRQIEDITDGERLKKELELKIDSCKHSATRMAVEQTADTSPVFKTLKKIVKEINSPNSSSSRVYHFIDKALSELDQSTTS